MHVPQEIADAGARWWANTLRTDDPDVDNGDLLQSALGSLNRKSALENVTADQIDEFEQNLADILAAEEVRGTDRYIKCDYHTHQLLADAAKEAGFEDSTIRSAFPWKTGMWLEQNRVLVSEGYGADREMIYSTDEWPPTVTEVSADTVELGYTTLNSIVDDHGPTGDVESLVSEFDGQSALVREIGDIEIVDREGTERHNQPATRFHAVLSDVTVLVNLDEMAEPGLTDAFPAELVRATFERPSYIDPEVRYASATGTQKVDAY